MLNIRHLIDILTGTAGLVISLMVFLPNSYHASSQLMMIAALIGLLRLNLWGANQSKKSNYQKIHMIGLALVIVAMILIYINIDFGNLLLLPAAFLVAIYYMIELWLQSKKDYLNVMHIFIYITGLIYVTELKTHWGLIMRADQLLVTLNIFIISTLIISGFRGLIQKSKNEFNVDETPIDFPSEHSS